MQILFDLKNSCGVRQVLWIIKELINIIRIVVPIGLVVLTGLDITKKVINPNDKEGGKKIMNRVIAAIVVFFVPLLIRIVLLVVDIGLGNSGGTSNSGVLDFWDSATKTC